jgi:DNA-binding response OmpR family regulator
MAVPNADVRILVIEDHAALARCIVEVLRDFGYVVLEPVADSASAVQSVEQGGFDVAVLDWTLQGEEAFAVADALLAKDCRFLLISGHARSRMPQRLREMIFLQKPFTTRALLSAVEAITTDSR